MHDQRRRKKKTTLVAISQHSFFVLLLFCLLFFFYRNPKGKFCFCWKFYLTFFFCFVSCLSTKTGPLNCKTEKKNCLLFSRKKKNSFFGLPRLFYVSVQGLIWQELAFAFQSHKRVEFFFDIPKPFIIFFRKITFFLFASVLRFHPGGRRVAPELSSMKSFINLTQIMMKVTIFREKLRLL